MNNVLRESALKRLEKIGTETIQEELMAMVRNPGNTDAWRARIIESFGASNNKKAMGALIATAGDAEMPVIVRNKAAEGITKIIESFAASNDKAVIGALVATAGDAEMPKNLRIQAAEGLPKLVDKTVSREVVENLTATLRGMEDWHMWEIQKHIADAIGESGSEIAMEALVAKVRNPATHMEVCLQIFQAMGKIGGEAAMKELIAVIHDESFDQQGIRIEDANWGVVLREGAIMAFGVLGRNAAMKEKEVVIGNLAETVYDPSKPGRLNMRALEALVVLGTKESEIKIAGIVNNAWFDDRMRIKAAKALGESGSKVVAPTLVEGLPSYSKELQFVVIETLDQLDTRTVKPELESVLLRKEVDAKTGVSKMQVSDAEVRCEIAKLVDKWS